MTIEEVFAQIGQHMIKGLMVHTQLSDYFNFLGLTGYHKCHEYHYYEESINYRKISNYYLEHYDKFITDFHVSNPQMIPEKWYQYSRQQVDPSTRNSAIQAGFEKWIKWETETLKLYQDLYKELLNMNEIAAASEINYYIDDVNKELSKAQQKYLELKMVNFDIAVVVDEQQYLTKQYIKKMGELHYD
jgi:hypothetical protein